MLIACRVQRALVLPFPTGLYVVTGSLVPAVYLATLSTIVATKAPISTSHPGRTHVVDSLVVTVIHNVQAETDKSAYC